MILSAGLKVNALVHPTHGPVDLPREFAVEVLCKIKGALVTAFAGVFGLCAIIAEGNNFCCVLAALGTVDAYGVIRLAFALLNGLGAVGSKNIENFSAFFERVENMLGIFAASVHFRLMTVVHIDTEFNY